MLKCIRQWLFLSVISFPLGGICWGQSVPLAPPAPTCSWNGDGLHSTCKFKDAVAGTPTSVVGNRVILFNRSTNGGYVQSRVYLREAVHRVASRYGFTATVTEDPGIFTAANLSDAKVVIMGYGEGDVVPPGANRDALEDFQQVYGWGLLWIHSACAFITRDWPFGQQSCVQTFLSGNPPGTPRRMFIDSGTSANPNQGIKNPQSEFLLRNLPGWGGNRTLQMSDRWFCFRAPARNTPGVNVLFGFDITSGPAFNNCWNRFDTAEVVSENHNMVWTHRMGHGISIYNSWGHNNGAYIDHGNMGDSLLWRFIRYAAKDWCVGGSGEPGCDGPLAIRASGSRPETVPLRRNEILSLPIPDAGRQTVSLTDIRGQQVISKSVYGPGNLDIPGLRRGLYLVRVTTLGKHRTRRIMVN